MSIKNSFKNIPQNSFPNDNCQQPPSPLYAKTVLQLKLNSFSPPHPQLKHPLNKGEPGSWMRGLSEITTGGRPWGPSTPGESQNVKRWLLMLTSGTVGNLQTVGSGSLNAHAICSPWNVLPTLPSWWTIEGLKTQVKNQHFWETKGVWGMSPHPKGKNGSPGLTTFT